MDADHRKASFHSDHADPDSARRIQAVEENAAGMTAP